MTELTPGWYVISPEGSAWIAVEIGEFCEIKATVEQHNAATHIAANDRFAPIAQAVQDESLDSDVPESVASQIVTAWDTDALPDMCVVDRIVLES